MDIGLRNLRQIEIDDIIQAIDINTSCCNVCSHEDPSGFALEIAERALAGILRFVAMNGLS